jgi:hypothetical protein
MIISYFLPLAPALSAAFLGWRYRPILKRPLTRERIAREANRTTILALAGFSFAGLIGIAALDATRQSALHESVYFLLVSFLSYFFALNLQSYKIYISRELLSSTLIDMASLCLLLAVCALIVKSSNGTLYKIVVCALAGVVWTIDHAIRIYYMSVIFKEERRVADASAKSSRVPDAAGAKH